MTTELAEVMDPCQEGEIGLNQWQGRVYFGLRVPVNIPTPSQFSRSVMSDSLQPHGLQHARPPCPSPTPGVHPNSCALSR